MQGRTTNHAGDPITRKKPRLFWMMLRVFILVIVMGVGGMLAVFGLSLAGIWQPAPIRESTQETQRIYSASLGDYYLAHGRSWAGVEQRLTRPLLGGPTGFVDYILLDEKGRVVTSTSRTHTAGEKFDTERFNRGFPIEVEGKRVGTLVMRPDFNLSPPEAPTPPQAPARPQNVVWLIARSFLLAGLGLAAVLFGMAIIFAQRLSRPLRGLTTAAQTVASGRLDVQVPGASVRELDELSQAFNTMARTLAEADRQRRQMTADVAHELRTPLTIIKGRLEGIQDGVYSAAPDQIEHLLHETALLERLIEDLRVLALADAGQMPLFPELAEPADLLAASAATFANQANEQRITITLAANDMLPSVYVDTQRIAQVLSNLVGNALRHTPEGGQIALRARTITGAELPTTSGRNDSPHILLQVSDTGQGIAAEELPLIFERFWRADRSRTRVSGGTGLGLAIARQIVVAHGGTIWAESTPGQGTTMNVTLPVANDLIATK